MEEKKDKNQQSIDKRIYEHFLKERKIFLWGAVSDESAEKIVSQLLFLDSQDSEDITFFINSPGGVITSGMAIYDAMKVIKSDVSTVVIGQAASMGSLLLTAGAKGKRFSWPSARVMIHQPLISGHIFGSASDIEIQAEEILRIRKELNQIIMETTGQSEQKIEEDTERDNFMTALEAKEYGLVDKVELIK